MYFTSSKIFWFLFAPSSVVVLLLAAGFLLLLTKRWRRAGLAATAGSLAGLVLMGFGPVGDLLTVPLENRFPACRSDPKRIDAVIVLGGAVQPLESLDRGQLLLLDAAERVIAMADYARRHPDWPVIFTGGSGDLLRRTVGEADVLESYIGVLGLEPGRIQFERTSRNTYENALFTARLVHPGPGRRFLLVTSALHMPRSVGLFRAAGYDVVPCPVDYTTRSGDAWSLFGRVSQGLSATDSATREWVGLLAAWVLGQSQTLFPAP